MIRVTPSDVNFWEWEVLMRAKVLCGFAPPLEDVGTPRGDAHRELIRAQKRLTRMRRLARTVKP